MVTTAEAGRHDKENAPSSSASQEVCSPVYSIHLTTNSSSIWKVNDENAQPKTFGTEFLVFFLAVAEECVSDQAAWRKWRKRGEENLVSASRPTMKRVSLREVPLLFCCFPTIARLRFCCADVRSPPKFTARCSLKQKKDAIAVWIPDSLLFNLCWS